MSEKGEGEGEQTPPKRSLGSDADPPALTVIEEVEEDAPEEEEPKKEERASGGSVKFADDLNEEYDLEKKYQGLWGEDEDDPPAAIFYDSIVEPELVDGALDLDVPEVVVTEAAQELTDVVQVEVTVEGAVEAAATAKTEGTEQVQLEEKRQSVESTPEAKRQSVDQTSEGKRQSVEQTPETKRKSVELTSEEKRLSLEQALEAKRQSLEQALEVRRVSLEQAQETRRQSLDQAQVEAKRQSLGGASDSKRQSLEQASETKRQSVEQAPEAKRQSVEQAFDEKRLSIEQAYEAERQSIEHTFEAKRQSIEQTFEAKRQSISQEPTDQQLTRHRHSLPEDIENREITPEEIFNEIKIARIENPQELTPTQNLHSYIISKTYSSENVVVLLNLRRMPDGEWVLDKTIAQGLKPETYGGVVSIDQYDFREPSIVLSRPPSVVHAACPAVTMEYDKEVADMLKRIEAYVISVNEKVDNIQNAPPPPPICCPLAPPEPPPPPAPVVYPTCGGPPGPPGPSEGEMTLLDQFVGMLNALSPDDSMPCNACEDYEVDTRSAIGHWMSEMIEDITSFSFFPGMGGLPTVMSSAIVSQSKNILEKAEAQTAALLEQSKALLEQVQSRKSILLDQSRALLDQVQNELIQEDEFVEKISNTLLPSRKPEDDAPEDEAKEVDVVRTEPAEAEVVRTEPVEADQGISDEQENPLKEDDDSMVLLQRVSGETENQESTSLYEIQIESEDVDVFLQKIEQQ